MAESEAGVAAVAVEDEDDDEDGDEEDADAEPVRDPVLAGIDLPTLSGSDEKAVTPPVNKTVQTMH